MSFKDLVYICENELKEIEKDQNIENIEQNYKSLSKKIKQLQKINENHKKSLENYETDIKNEDCLQDFHIYLQNYKKLVSKYETLNESNELNEKIEIYHDLKNNLEKMDKYGSKDLEIIYI